MDATTRIYALVHMVFLVCVAALVHARGYSAFELTGIIITTGLTGGAAFNAAHELCHKKNAPDRFLSATLLAALAYPGFLIEHPRHHHRWVGTPRDPSSAPAGRSLYRHFFYAIPGNIRNAFRQGKSRSLRDPWYRLAWLLWIYAGVIYLAVAMFAGLTAVGVWLGAALISILWLEIANYFQHYGLRRELRADGRYEPVGDHHCWDVDQPRLNKVWGNLPLHADHHAHPAKPFPELRPAERSFRYPFGYVGCTLLALFPRKWAQLVDQLKSSGQTGEQS